MTDDQRRFLHDALTSILRAEEDTNIEQLSKEDIREETKSITLESPPEPVKPRDTGELMRAPMDVSKEMELLKHASPEDEAKRIRDILIEAGLYHPRNSAIFAKEVTIMTKERLTRLTEMLDAIENLDSMIAGLEEGAYDKYEVIGRGQGETLDRADVLCELDGEMLSMIVSYLNNKSDRLKDEFIKMQREMKSHDIDIILSALKRMTVSYRFVPIKTDELGMVLDMHKDDGPIDGKWYWWLDRCGNLEFARLKFDAYDHFFPQTKHLSITDPVRTVSYLSGYFKEIDEEATK